jgi:GMP synthase-like glutamine amidotransferase
MLPVAIFRHAPIEGPGYFAIFLENNRLPWQLIAIDQGEPLPANAEEFSGLCFMGGPMSVNDPLPWIDNACALIRDADARGLPVIGHCLGGQLMSKAFGGEITRNPVKEIGWGSVFAEPGQTVQDWLGTMANRPLHAFHWHGETFSLPAGACRILSSHDCTNQAYVRGPHLAMQCHIEMTAGMIEKWCQHWPEEVAGITDFRAIQTPQAMQSERADKLPAMRALADTLYQRWIKGLAR